MTDVVKRSPAGVFFVLAFVLTWAVWVPRALVSEGLMAASWPLILGPVSTYGPAVAALLAAALSGGRRAVRELLSRLGRWRVGWRWYAVVLVGPVAVWLVATGVYIALGGSIEDAKPPVADVGLLGAAPLLLALCLTDGLGEETGWRGYALPRLLERHSPLAASLGLGVVWAAWHLPLVWTEGANLYQSPFWWLFVDLPIGSVIYTWIFQRTRGSALLAVLLHGMFNAFALPLPSDGAGRLTPYLLGLATRLLVALVVVGVTGPRWSRRLPSPRVV